MTIEFNWIEWNGRSVAALWESAARARWLRPPTPIFALQSVDLLNLTSWLFAISIDRAVWPLDGVNETASVKATRAEGSRKESGRRAEGSRKEAGRKCEESKAEVEDWRRKEQMAANQRISSRESWQLSCSLLRLLSGPRLSRIPKESPKNPQRILFKSLSKISLNLWKIPFWNPKKSYKIHQESLKNPTSLKNP